MCIRDRPFTAGSDINIYLAGYPGRPGLALGVENLQTGQQLPLHILNAPGEKWELHHFRLPAEWKGQLVRVISQDRATGLGGWAAFSEPIPATQADELVDAAKTFGLVVFLAIVLLVPSVAACMLAARRGMENPLYLTCLLYTSFGKQSVENDTVGVCLTVGQTIVFCGLPGCAAAFF